MDNAMKIDHIANPKPRSGPNNVFKFWLVVGSMGFIIIAVNSAINEITMMNESVLFGWKFIFISVFHHGFWFSSSHIYSKAC
jgi:hypothetical protein